MSHVTAKLPRTMLALLLTVALGLPTTFIANPLAAAQEDDVVTVTGSVFAGDAPLEDVRVGRGVTNADGAFSFTYDREGGFGVLRTTSLVQTMSPPFELAFPSFGASGITELDIVLPAVIDLEIQISPLCLYNQAIIDGCSPGDLGYAEDFFVRVFEPIGTVAGSGDWHVFTQLTTNGSVTVPIFDTDFAVRLSTPEGGREVLVPWDGSNPFVIGPNDMNDDPTDWYPDNDEDGFGQDDATSVPSDGPPGPNFVENNLDCDDTNAQVFPGAAEVPNNGIDDDCDGVDEMTEPVLCLGLPVTIDMNTGASGVGTSGDDVILGTNSADFINGKAGNDTICAGGGRDLIKAGTGDDVVSAGSGADTVYGSTGDDDIHGGSGNDLIYGGGGRDMIRAGTGNDTVRGNAGADEIRGQGGNDYLLGNRGDDLLVGDIGNDDLRGGPGNDTLRGGFGEDELRGQPGQDLLVGGSNDDLLMGGEDDDILFSGSGADSVFGDDGTDSCPDISRLDTVASCEA